MDIIYVNEKIVINWTICRNASEVLEDFTKADLRVFLIGNDFDGNYDGKYYFGNELDAEGRVVTTIEAGSLTPGTYCIEALWIKNRHELDKFSTRTLSRARKDRIFKVVEAPEDFSDSSSYYESSSYDENPNPAIHEINIKTGVTSYGYDGMSAYETAVFEYSTKLSEQEWIERYQQAEDRINYEMEEDTPGTWANAEKIRKENEGIGTNPEDCADGSRRKNEYVRQQNESERQAAEAERQITFETNEGTEQGSVAGDHSRWGDYKQAELDRGTSYVNAEGTNASPASNNNRWGQYRTAENSRQEAYTNAEGTSSDEPQASNRWGAYKRAEGSLEDSEKGDSDRWGQYKEQEGTPESTSDDSRWAEYNTAEAGRNTSYGTAEGAATDAASSTGSRWARYKYAENTRGAAYDTAEGEATDASSATGSRWARFNKAQDDRTAAYSTAEAARTAAMGPIMGYYSCATAASTAAKEVSATNYVLTSGGSIKVKFTYANSASSPTLNINSTGAKAIVYNGAVASATNTWAAGDVVEFYYDPTYNSNAGAFVGIPTVVSVSQNTLTIGGVDKGELAGQLIESPEWVKVVTDSEDKILYGVKTDGKFYFGDGCPPQVQEYVTNYIKEYGLEELIKSHFDYYNVSKHHSYKEYFNVYTVNDGWEKIAYNSSLGEYDDLDIYQIGEQCNFGGDTANSYQATSQHRGVAPATITQDFIIRPVYTLSEALEAIPDDIKSSFFAGQIICFTNANDDVETWELQADDTWSQKMPTEISNQEFIQVTTDSEGKILQSRNSKGVNKEYVGIETPVVSIDGATIENIQDAEERTEIKTDSEGKILSYRDSEGVLHENLGIVVPALSNVESINNTPVSQIGVEKNITREYNLPKYGSIDINKEISFTDGENSYAPTEISKVNNKYYVTASLVDGQVTEDSIEVNLVESDVDTSLWPVDKSKHYCKVIIDFGEYLSGTYYIEVKYQGNSSLVFQDFLKKNFRFTFYKDLLFAKKLKVKIGEFVTTNKFNVKAYWLDKALIREPFAYRIIQSIYESKDYNKQYPWNSDYNIFCGATGLSLNFPTKVSTSGNFYGVMWFGLAKDKNNVMLDDEQMNGIWIQCGTNSNPTTWSILNNTDWEDLLADTEPLEPENDCWPYLETFWSFLNTSFTKQSVSQHMDVDSWIDTIIIMEVLGLIDNCQNNVILYTKSDKTIFYPLMYDADACMYYSSTHLGNQSVLTPNVGDARDKSIWVKFNALYWEEICDRYSELRKNILDPDHLASYMQNLSRYIPYNDYVEEVERWGTGRETNPYHWVGTLNENIQWIKNRITFLDSYFKY